MKRIDGNIVDIESRRIVKGSLLFDEYIHRIVEDATVTNEQFILPGLIDAHVHIESTMLSPQEYAKLALKHGVVAAVADPHEIANVCGIEGVRYMIDQAKRSPMKMFFGAPSCVPATDFECSGARLDVKDLEALFSGNECSHLAEMMNFPGVIYKDPMVMAKLELAHRFGKVIDGHAPQLSGKDLRDYVRAGIVTDHECTTIHEALEKISLGMNIMLRNSSASKDFPKLISLIKTHPEQTMLCTDDCHPDELQKGYINLMVKAALEQQYNLFDVLTAAVKTAKKLYQLPVGILQKGDPADFIVIDSLSEFKVLATYINGEECFDAQKDECFTSPKAPPINNFYVNALTPDDLLVPRTGKTMKVIQLVPDSLLTKKLLVSTDQHKPYVQANPDEDLLKIVVLNRYQKAKPAIGFIKGFELKSGAIASSIAHDSHNIVAVGVSDEDLLRAIAEVQRHKGGLAVCDEQETLVLPLPIAGLMSDESCERVAAQYQHLSAKARQLGSRLHAPFMTLAFMSLLVIPELKLGDGGLFDVDAFQFVALQHET